MVCSGSECTGLHCEDCPELDRIVDRLGAYEDTGLTPELCAEFAQADAEGRYIVMRDAGQAGVARLRELAAADKEGRVLIRPSKPGDTVFRIWVTSERKPEITEYYMTDYEMVVSWLHLFGKTVFLTREEAERAIEGRKNG